MLDSPEYIEERDKAASKIAQLADDTDYEHHFFMVIARETLDTFAQSVANQAKRGAWEQVEKSIYGDIERNEHE